MCVSFSEGLFDGSQLNIVLVSNTRLVKWLSDKIYGTLCAYEIVEQVNF